MENETYKVKAKKAMFEDRLWRGIHITGVSAYLKSTGFGDSLQQISITVGNKGHCSENMGMEISGFVFAFANKNRVSISVI